MENESGIRRSLIVLIFNGHFIYFANVLFFYKKKKSNLYLFLFLRVFLRCLTFVRMILVGIYITRIICTAVA